MASTTKKNKNRQTNPLFNAPRATWRFITEARDELKKVQWPTRATTIQYTILVIIGSAIVGSLTGAIDYGLAKLLEQII